MQALHPNSTTFMDEKNLFEFAKAYDSNLEDMKHEVHQVKSLFERKNGVIKPCTALDCVNFSGALQRCISLIIHAFNPLFTLSQRQHGAIT